MTVSKDKKSEYNKRAYEIRKAKKEEQRKKINNEIIMGADEPTVVEDNVSVSESAPPEVEELEISQSDYNKFLQWQREQADGQDVKKKISEDPSYLISIFKTLGVALVPALISAVQRAAAKTMEQQKNQGTRSEHFTEESVVTGSSQWDPLSAPKFSIA